MTAAQLDAGRKWLAEHGLNAHMYLAGSLDGLAAGALIARRAQGDASFIDPFGRELDRDGPLVIVAQGIKRVQAAGPVLYVDHHTSPHNKVKGTVVWDASEAATSVLTWRMIGAPAKLGWLATLGRIDRGGSPGPEAGDTVGCGALAELCLSATRLRDGPLTTAFAMLQGSDSPQEALDSPEAARLRQAKARVDELLREAARTPPQIGPAAALIDIDVPAFVHPQLAMAWAKRLAPLPVLVANHGWRPNRVAYSIRLTPPREMSASFGIATPVLADNARRVSFAGADGALGLQAFSSLQRRLSTTA